MIRTIPLKIQNEYITGDKGMIGAAGSHNDVILRMEFSGMWDGLTKMVQFRDALGEATIEVLLTADMLEADDTSVYLVPVPSGAKKYAGEMTLCIKGASVSAQKETRATLAVYGRFTVAESKWSADAETETDVPASNVEQLQGQINNVLATIVDVRKAATEAAKSEAAAKNAAETAAVILSATQNSAQNASESAKAAEKSAQDASQKYTFASAAANDAATFAQRAANSATAAKASEDAAAGSAANAAASATSAGKSAANAATSASVASSKAGDAITAASDAQAAKSKAEDSQVAAKLSENNAAGSAASAAESIKHAPRINADGKWELWDATKNAYVATEYTAIGKDGTRGRGWYQQNVGTSLVQAVVWDGSIIAPKWGKGDWLYNPDNGNVGLCTSRTDNADGSGHANITYTGTLKGADGTTPHIGENGNWYIGNTDTGVKAAGTDYVLTAADKSEIAALVLAEIPDGDEVAYG
nr:MAG TPA: L SHAPED TAIL FIBER PROTEIN [Caudoviricetes sp.]